MISHEKTKLHNLPPDAGWSYVIAVATTVVYIATIVPLGAFGLIFGTFLATLGDSTSGITLVSGTFTTVSFFTGLVANVLLNRYSYRKVGLLGGLVHFVGAFGTVYVTNLVGLIISYGVLQGMGFGLIIPSALSAFNAYFDKKMTLMMSLSQTGVVVCYMIAPQVCEWTMENFGFRGTLLLLSGLSLFCFPAALTLQPVKWHMRNCGVSSIENSSKHGKRIAEPLLRHGEVPDGHKTFTVLGERIGSLSSVNVLSDDDKSLSFCQSLLKSMELHLLKDPKYLNISLGLALSFTADVAFYPIVPSIMSNIGFSGADVALMMTAYFGADLTARVALSIVAAFFTIKSRYLVLGAAAFSAIFRIVLILHDTFRWKVALLAILGLVRCFIQTPQALVIAEEYPNNFATAYSLYMAVNGVVCLIFGLVMSLVKTTTNSDIWVCHVLTLSFVANVISWSVEMFACKKRPTSGQSIS